MVPRVINPVPYQGGIFVLPGCHRPVKGYPDEAKEEGDLNVRALRGATTAKGNSRLEILEAARELVLEVISRNSVKPEDLACIIFSSTPDLDAAFPAAAAREAGLNTVPLFGAQEVGVEGSPEKCIRLLALFNTEKTQADLRHVYLRGAAVLRPDLQDGGETK